ncbi:uncharacterized protein LOC116805239 [Drosophila grimshawi]|uniref:uncharacterized protein LOC116805239 n=1 Tax=Drosophila grimshawi TaxID=7222 RepID=UPI000C86F835|nr:uncharacterized protein LOC116805239 [Drosophila grimshawi]
MSIIGQNTRVACIKISNDFDWHLMENNKIACEAKHQPPTEIDIGIVKIEKDTIPEFNIAEKMELHWEETHQKEHQTKTIHRGQRMVNWREAEVNYLIDLIKSHSYVWDTSVPDFKKKHLKAHFWYLAADKINGALKPRTPFTRNDCFKKWNNLRTYFQADLKSVKTKNNGSLSDAEDHLAGGWKYSSRMSFLLGCRPPQPTFNHIDHSVFETSASLSDSNGEMESEMGSGEPCVVLEPLAQDTQDNEFNRSNENFDDVLESIPERPQAKRKRKPTEMTENALLHKLSGVTSNQTSRKQEPPSNCYSRYVGQCLDRLDPDLNLEAREKICEILFRYERVQLERQ